MILASASGLSDVAVGAKLRASNATVGTWRKRFARERLEGLYGDRAALDCLELGPHTTQFTLRVPAAG